MSLVRTFDADGQRAGIMRLLAQMFGYPAMIWRNRFMVQNFFRRELMSRFHGSFLGAWWMLVQPVFLFAVYYLVFGMLYGSGVKSATDMREGAVADVHFAVYLFAGVMVFHALTEATMTSCNAITSNSSLVKKVAFPSEVLPIPTAMISVVLYLIGGLVGVIFGLAFGVVDIGWHWLMVPIVCVVQFVLIVGMGLFLANANVFIRDVGQLWRIATMAWMFLSPVFWKPEMMVGALGDTWSSVLFNVNPAYSLIMSHRWALLGDFSVSSVSTGDGVVLFGSADFWGTLGVASIWAAGFMVLGFTTFASSKHKYADVV